MNFRILVLILLLPISGCIKGHVHYQPPEQGQLDVSKYTSSVEKPVDDVWKAVVSFVSDEVFVMDHVLKDSYLVNLSYGTKNPCQYITCGTLESFVQNARGPRTYRFPACEANTRFESVENGNLILHNRSMSLNGKINIILIPDDLVKTKIKINSKYIVNKNVSGVNYAAQMFNQPNSTGTFSSNMSFNTNDQDTDSANVTCKPTGELESYILTGIKKRLGM